MTYKSITSKNVMNIFKRMKETAKPKSEKLTERGNQNERNEHACGTERKRDRDTQWHSEKWITCRFAVAFFERIKKCSKSVHIARIARAELPLMSIMFGKARLILISNLSIANRFILPFSLSHSLSRLIFYLLAAVFFFFFFVAEPSQLNCVR